MLVVTITWYAAGNFPVIRLRKSLSASTDVKKSIAPRTPAVYAPTTAIVRCLPSPRLAKIPGSLSSPPQSRKSPVAVFDRKRNDALLN